MATLLSVVLVGSWAVLTWLLCMHLFGKVLGEASVQEPTSLQFGTFAAFVAAISLWGYQELYNLLEHKVGPMLESGRLVDSAPEECEVEELMHEAPSHVVPEAGRADPDESSAAHPAYLWKSLPTVAPTFVSLPTLRICAELSCVMIGMYVSDRTNTFSTGDKVVSMDLFWFSYLWLVLPSLFSIRHAESAPKGSIGFTGLLQRDQTEEWKGWMQVLFLLYHYYAAASIYNAIRLFIAAYVWMTGFGNFSYYYIRANFSAVRFMQMMWRLNFFVALTCVVLNNDYMCYYICPLHTLWTLFIYVSLGIGRGINKTLLGITAKVIAVLVVVLVVWDIPGVWDAVFGPFRFLLRYSNPHHPEFDDMQEWRFRSGLDRFVWIFGMLCAYNFPNMERVIDRVESWKPVSCFATKLAVLAVCVAVLKVYNDHVFSLPKNEYNALHPTTSFIPISIFIIVRNLFPRFRGVYNHVFCWLGKITLETYILQYHIWLKTEKPNYQPKHLLVLIENSPMVNFALCSLVYIFVSKRVFAITVHLRDVVIAKDGSGLCLRAVLLVVFWAVVWGLGWGIKALRASPLSVP